MTRRLCCPLVAALDTAVDKRIVAPSMRSPSTAPLATPRGQPQRPLVYDPLFDLFLPDPGGPVRRDAAPAPRHREDGCAVFYALTLELAFVLFAGAGVLAGHDTAFAAALAGLGTLFALRRPLAALPVAGPLLAGLIRLLALASSVWTYSYAYVQFFAG